MPRTAPLAEVNRTIDGRKVTRLTRLDPDTGAAYDSWTTAPADVAGQGRVWRDSGWSRSSTPSERYHAAVGGVRVRGPELSASEKVQANLAELRLTDPALADKIASLVTAKLPATADGQLFDPGKVSVSLAAISGPPSGSYLVPADIDAYVLRHSRGEAGGFGTVKPFAELSEDERFCPPKFGHCAESSAAIETGHGLVISAYDVWAPDRPLTRKGDSIYVLTLLVPGRDPVTTVASDRDGISF